MAELKDRLRSDLTAAMKSRDKLRTATLRMLLAAIQTEEVSGKQAVELTDGEVLKVQVVDATEISMKVRVLLSAPNASISSVAPSLWWMSPITARAPSTGTAPARTDMLSSARCSPG